MVKVAVWQFAQPMLTNWFEPLHHGVIDGSATWGSQEAHEERKLGGIVEQVHASGGSHVECVVGAAVGEHCGVSSRSLGNTRFVTPCSTLYASPAKTCRDLFCDFHPKRVTLPSFPLRFSLPEMPRPDLPPAFNARLLTSAASGMASISPSP